MWTDVSESDNGSVVAVAGCKYRDCLEAIHSHLGIGQMEVYYAEVYQQNTFLSLQNSESVWEVLHQHLTVVTFQSSLD